MMKKSKPAAKGKMVSEYGGMKKYGSKSAMEKHEKMESKSMEAKEKMMMKKGKK